MLKISILTLFPQVIEPFIRHSIIGRAVEKGKVTFNVFQLRDFAHDKHKTVDDRPYGGSAGMLLKIEPLVEAITYIEEKQGKAYKVLLTPSGELLTQTVAKAFVQEAGPEHVLIICGHYEGFDARIKQFIDTELSIGKYVLSSGEAAAMVVIDSIVRLIPGVLKKDEATAEETFFTVSAQELYEVTQDSDVYKVSQEGKVTLLEYPQYTRPAEFAGMKVPSELAQGDHKEIKKWQLKKAWEETKKKIG